MNAIVLAGTYALVGDILATFAAATVAVVAQRRVGRTAIGTVLGLSGGFIVGAAFLDLIGEAQQRGHSNLVVGAGVAVGLLLMIGLEALLGAFGLGEEEEEEDEKKGNAKSGEQQGRSKGTRGAAIISIGMAIHNVPEALPIGAALVISPALSLLVAIVMMVETFAESTAIAGELMGEKASAAKMYGLTMWPSIFSLVGGILGVILAGISPVVLAFTLALAGGIMLFISGEVWSDGRKDAGAQWSSIGLLVGVLLALWTSTIGKS